jgi:hypothetical protein
MKTFARILVIGFELATISAKAHKRTLIQVNTPRRLQEPVSTMAAAALLSELAKNTKIPFDANKGLDQLSTLMSSGAIDGAVVLNMDKNGLGHKLFMMPDVVNMNHTVYHENFCAFNAACDIFKTKLLGASGKIKVCIDSAWGAANTKTEPTLLTRATFTLGTARVSTSKRPLVNGRQVLLTREGSRKPSEDSRHQPIRHLLPLNWLRTLLSLSTLTRVLTN